VGEPGDPVVDLVEGPTVVEVAGDDVDEPGTVVEVSVVEDALPDATGPVVVVPDPAFVGTAPVPVPLPRVVVVVGVDGAGEGGAEPPNRTGTEALSPFRSPYNTTHVAPAAC